MRTLLCIFLALGFVPAAYAPDRIVADVFSCPTCPPSYYDLWLRAKAVEQISYLTPEPGDAYGWGEQLAVLIEAGNEVWREIRASQDRIDWYVGNIQPLGPRTGSFVWMPDQRLCFVLHDGRRIYSAALIVTSGEARRLGPVRYLGMGLTATFEDITVQFPGIEGCPIYAGFPRGRWDLSDVDELLIVRE